MDTDSIPRALGAIDLHGLLGRVVDRLGSDRSPGARLVQEYAYEVLGRSDEDGAFDPDLAEHSEDFETFLADKAEEELHGAVDRLSREVKVCPDGRVEAWREMVVPADWPVAGIRERPVGVFWAFKEEAAEAHWGERETQDSLRIVVHAAVEPDGIDWEESVVANAVDGANEEEECELRLKDSAVVEVLGLAVRKGHWTKSAEAVDAAHLVGEFLPVGEPATIPAPGRS